MSTEVVRGDIGIWTISPLMKPWSDKEWSIGSGPIADSVVSRLSAESEATFELLGFRYESSSVPGLSTVIFIPIWAVAIATAAAAAATWVKWRIGWRAGLSAACVLIAILLLGMWARSNRWFDLTDRSSAMNVCSVRGKLFVGENFMLMGNDSLNPQEPVPQSHFGIVTLARTKFELVPLGGGVAAPYWLMALVMGAIATVPWFPARFSLRTLLIATTLVAAVLGLIAWSKR